MSSACRRLRTANPGFEGKWLISLALQTVAGERHSDSYGQRPETDYACFGDRHIQGNCLSGRADEFAIEHTCTACAA